MRILLILLIILTSCKNNQDRKSDEKSIETNSDFKNNSKSKIKDTSFFLRIPYNLKYDYFDSLATKINPNKQYEYWQYSRYNQSITGEIKYRILREGGDLSKRKKISEKIDPIKVLGIFQDGHPSYRYIYAIYIENQKINYIKTEEEFRNFLGSIDNLEEALLLARTYGYVVGSEPIESQYKKSKNGFVLHLLKYYEYPPSKELIEIEIHKDGFVKTKSLGIFKTGREANE
jgi:hypothetical protein